MYRDALSQAHSAAKLYFFMNCNKEASALNAGRQDSFHLVSPQPPVLRFIVNPSFSSRSAVLVPAVLRRELNVKVQTATVFLPVRFRGPSLSTFSMIYLADKNTQVF